MQGTNTGHENGEAMASVGVRLTDQLGTICDSECKALRSPICQFFAEFKVLKFHFLFTVGNIISDVGQVHAILNFE